MGKHYLKGVEATRVKAEVCEAYRNGEPVRSIAERVGRQPQLIYRWLRDAGVELRQERPARRERYQPLPTPEPDAQAQAPVVEPDLSLAIAGGASLEFFVSVRDNPHVPWGERLKAAAQAYKIQSEAEAVHWQPPVDQPELWAEAVADAIEALPEGLRERVALRLHPSPGDK